jgi:GT2 family glycosyltransferase
MLSIVIPSHQRTDLLSACLASVTRHAPAGTEVIVVDDASRGGRVGKVAAAFAGIKVLRLPRRSGFCVAANAGIRASTGEIVELLNDDTEVQAGWADAALAWFTDPEIAAVAPLVFSDPEGTRVDSAGDRYYLGGVAGKRGHGQAPAPEYFCSRPIFGASASSAFYRRSAFDRVGGFPESFQAYFEDVDLAFRLQRASYRAIFEPSSRVWHKIGASYGRPRRRLLEQQSRNEERVFWRNIPGPDLVRALPRHLAVLAAKAVRRWREGNLLPFLCGRLRLLTEIPELIRHRRNLALLGPAVSVESWQVDTHWRAAGRKSPVDFAQPGAYTPGSPGDSLQRRDNRCSMPS